jgi:hypothetical protein
LGVPAAASALRAPGDLDLPDAFDATRVSWLDFPYDEPLTHLAKTGLTVKTAKKTLLTAVLAIGMIGAGSGMYAASAAPTPAVVMAANGNHDSGNGLNSNDATSYNNDNRATRDSSSSAQNSNTSSSYNKNKAEAKNNSGASNANDRSNKNQNEAKAEDNSFAGNGNNRLQLEQE